MRPWDRSRGRPEPIRALNRVRLYESGEPLVHLAEIAPTVRVGRPQTIPYVRQTVGEMAERAARSLPRGVRLAVTDAWRPFERQVRIYEFMTRCAQEAYPGLTYAALRRKVNRFVAPVDQPAPPGHCTGAAIDVILTDEAGEPLDVTSPFGRFESAPTYVYGLSPEAQGNRTLLVETMLEAGFSNCRDEWWHYSYGDASWAVRAGAESCVYGLIALPDHLYEEQEQLWMEAMRDRPNPFLTGK